MKCHSFKLFFVSFCLLLSILVGFPGIPSLQLNVKEAQAELYSTAVSNVDPGWQNNRKRVLFFNGSRFFLLYSKGEGDGLIYYKSSPDNDDWESAGESTLDYIDYASLFDIYLVSDTKFDVAYYRSVNQTRYVRTCTIDGTTIDVGDPSSGINETISSIAVARSGAGEGRIYLAARGSAANLRASYANSPGDAANVSSWTSPLDFSDKGGSTRVAIVPYQGADKTLVVYNKDGGGSNSDGVYSSVISPSGAETEAEVNGAAGGFNSLPDFSSPVSISDTDFRIAIKLDSGSQDLEEWKWNGVDTWSLVEVIDTEIDQQYPSLFYDRISGDMYLFSHDTGTDDIERHYKSSSGSWQAEVEADGEPLFSLNSYPITQMHEPPYESARIGPRVLVWGYRTVVAGPSYALKVGSLVLSPGISSHANQVFAVGQTATTISQITITEGDTPTITAANDLRIRITPGIDMVWDTSASPTYGGTYSGNVISTSYEDNDRVLVLDIDTDFAAGETLTINDAAFNTFASVNAPLPGLQLLIDGPADTGVDAADDKTITIKAAVTLADHTAGQVTDKFAGQTETETTTEYFQFQLDNDGERASTALTVDLSSISGIFTGDVTTVELWADVTGDGLVTAGTAWSSYATTESEIFCYTFDSTNNVIYAGASNGIIFRCEISTGCDEFTDWTTSYDTTESQIRSLIFDSEKNVIYAGSNGTSYIYRCDTSTGCDEAADWTSAYESPGPCIYSFALDQNNNVIYAVGSGASDNIVRCDTASGCDEDADWSRAYDTGMTAWSLTFDSTNSVVYAGNASGYIFRCDTTSNTCIGGDGWISYDTGETNVYSLTFDSVNNILYAGTGNAGVIYRCDTSTGCDAFSDWTTSYDTPDSYIWSFTFDSVNNILYAGTGSSDNVYSCDTSTGCDEAGDWTSSYIAGGDVRALTYDSANNVIYGGDGLGYILRKFEGDYRVRQSFSWTKRTPDNSYMDWFLGVAHDGAGQWVAVGMNGEIQSWNGVDPTWTHHDAANSYSDYFEAVAHDGTGLWVAVGNLGEIQTWDGTGAWVHQNNDGSFADYFRGIAHDSAGLWVAVGNLGEIQSSANGTVWAQETPAAGYNLTFYGVAHDGIGKWVAVGMSGEIQSWDGIASTWTQEATGGTNYYDVAYGAGQWVAVGSGGKIETSPDGSTWTPRTAAAGYTDAFYGIAYDAGSGLWTAVGVYGEIQTSPDGINWTRRYPAGSYSDTFRDVAYGAGLWTAVGIGGEIQTSCSGVCYGQVDITGATGTITFDELGTLPAGTMDYILRGTISNIADGDKITFGLDTSGVLATGEVSGKSLTISGATTSVTHWRGAGTFGFRKSITIDRTKIPETCGTTLLDFPMLFSVTDGDLATIGNGGDVASYDVATNDPRDIIFRALDEDTCGGPGTAPCGLYHEIEEYDETSGEIVAWVRIPSVNTNAASSDTVIYVYYGNSDMPYSSQNVNGVWDDNYAGVWHLKESGSGAAGEYKDSTSNPNDGQGGGGTAGSVPSLWAGTKIIGDAQDFDGDDDYIDCGNHSSLDITGDKITVEAWVQLREVNPGGSSGTTIAGKGNRYFLYQDWDADYRISFSVNPTGGPLYTSADGNSLNTWYHVAGTYDGTNAKIYVDGTEAGSSIAGSGTIQSTANNLQIGRSDPFNGPIDEVRISKSLRSQCWIKAEYNNQVWPDKAVTPTPDPSPNPDSGFYTVGGEEPNPPTAITLVSLKARGQGSSVLVEWETAQEIKNAGFNLYRAESPFGPFTRLNDKLIPVLTFSVKGKSYSFMDSDVTRGQLYYYRLEDIDVYAKKTFHGPICVDWDGDGLPDDWETAYGFDPLMNDSALDPDGDSLTNLEEYEYETDPFNPDSDGDGIPDGQESGKVERGEPVETQTLTQGVQIVASDDSGVTLELRTGSYEMEVVQVDEDIFQRLRIFDYVHGFTSEVGKPELPMKGLLLDLPDGVSVTLKVEETESQKLEGYWIYPVPEKAVSGEEGTEYVAEFFAIDETAYCSDAFYPDIVARLGETYLFRDQQKLQVRFYPFAFNPGTRELKYYTRIRVRVEYVAAQSTTRSASRALAVPVPSSPSTSPSSRALAWTPPSPNPIYKILVSEEGIYRLTGTWLAANGVNVTSMALDQIRLYNLGQELAVHVYDQDGDNRIDSSDYIEFYGKAVEVPYAKYTKQNVFWLTDSGISGGLRMGTVDGNLWGTQVPSSAYASTLRYEEDKQYEGSAPGPDSLDRWFFDRFVTGADWPGIHPWYGGVGTDFDLQLPEVDGQGSLTITLFAPFDMAHEVEVSVNSTVRIFSWSGIAYHEVTIDSVDLVEGLNNVTLRCNMASDGIIVDRFEVTYPRRFVVNGDMLKFSHAAGSRYRISGFSTNNLLAFDITQPRNVRRGVVQNDFAITGPDPVNGTYTLDMEPQHGAGKRTYLVLSTDEVKLPLQITRVVDPDLSNGANGADYILITHRDLGWDENGDAYPWLSDLVALRQGQGLRVKVVDVEDIYNEFSYGIVTPQAIKNFLAHAYNSWTRPAAQYVLLVGDSTYDYKDNLGLGTINFVPSYLSWTDYMGETLTDDWFARVSGGDAMPDLYIGRLPAATVAQAGAMVNKIFTYESTTNTKNWEENTLLVADEQTEYYEALFEIMSNDVAALIPSGMNTPFKEYLADYIDPEDLRATIKGKIKNEGTLIVNYSGHGALQRWASPLVFHVDDVAALDNGLEAPKYPFFVSMTCLNGYFGYPETGPGDVSLAEVLLRSENEGAVGAFMSTGMTQPEGQRVLDEGLFDAIFKQDNRVLGLAVCMAKQTLLANGVEFGDVSKTFLLFGDPATRLKVPLPTVPGGVAAQSEDGSVVLSWQAAADCNGWAVAGYNVYRTPTPGGPYTEEDKLNTALIAGTGFTDTSATSGTWYYVITSEDDDGDESAPSAELGIVAGSRTLSGGSAEGAGGSGGGCFIGTIAD